MIFWSVIHHRGGHLIPNFAAVAAVVPVVPVVPVVVDPNSIGLIWIHSNPFWRFGDDNPPGILSGPESESSPTGSVAHRRAPSQPLLSASTKIHIQKNPTQFQNDPNSTENHPRERGRGRGGREGGEEEKWETELRVFRHLQRRLLTVIDRKSDGGKQVGNGHVVL